MKIAVIGAGPAGLVAVKYCIQEGYECEVFEQTEFLGGIWNYTDEVGLDKNGLPVHTPMYKNLRTNLPKEVMAFEDFPFPIHMEESFITQGEVLKYLNDYADKMDLKKHIKFLTLVTLVEPIPNNKWNIEIQDVITKHRIIEVFDAVIVCNGKYEVPHIPHIAGLKSFTGRWIHSHDYRDAEYYKNKVVLVIGGGPSAYDISRLLYPVVKKLLVSYRDFNFARKFPKGHIWKSLVKKIEEDSVIFEDGSEERGIDQIVLCTGYNYDFPFLSTKCNIIVDQNYVRNLYKEVLNIYHPSMAILGIPSMIVPIPTAEIQMRFFLASFSGHYTLPPLEAMLKEVEEYRNSRNTKNRYIHKKCGNMEREYFDDLAKSANVRPVPIVITDIHNSVKKDRNNRHRFRIIDDEHFILTPSE